MKKRLLAVAVLAVAVSGFASCPPRKPPTPVPTPTPAPTPIPESPKIVDGKWVPALRGATNCCDDPTTPGDEGLADGWALITPSALDRIKGPGTVNWTHVRLGPFAEVTESSITALAGKERAKGRAILASVRSYGPGPGVLDDARAAGLEAARRGIYVEWDVVDNWALVNSEWNFFGDGCSVTAAAPPQRYLDWVNQVVEATWDLPGMYNLGNEAFRCPSSAAWENGLADALRTALAAKGVSRPIGNTVTVDNKRVTLDYRTFHGFFAPPADWSGIPAMLTESDNDVHGPEQWASLVRTLEESGMYASIWRGPESWDAHNVALAAMPRLGDKWGETPCYPPFESDPLWVEPPSPGGGMSAEVRAAVDSAKATVGERCGTDHQGSLATLDAVGAELRRQGLCAGRMNDSVFVLDGQLWKELHLVTFASGCWSQDPAQVPKNTWTYSGTNPTPPGSCPIEVPTVDEVFCKLHQAGQGLWDCTPKAHGQPILPEGDPNRPACEKKAMGGAYPVYSLEVLSGAITLATVAEPMQFKIQGSGSGVVTCHVPAVAGPLCNTAVSR